MLHIDPVMLKPMFLACQKGQRRSFYKSLAAVPISGFRCQTFPGSQVAGAAVANLWHTMAKLSTERTGTGSNRGLSNAPGGHFVHP